MKKENSNKFARKQALILFVILLVALLFRLYKIDTPLADFHSWRQVDTAAVARNFVNNGFNLFQPTYDDLSNIQTGLENPQGLRLVEFPIYNASFALLYKYVPLTSLEVYGRLTTIFFSLVVIAVLFYFLYKEVGLLAAIVGSGVYAIFPFFVFFSRVILPETAALAFTFLGLFFMYQFALSKSRVKTYLFYVLSVVLFAAGILTKPPVIFFAIVYLYLFLKKYRWDKSLKKPQLYLFFLLAFLPFVLWRVYIAQFPQGVPASEWLITSVNTSEGVQRIFLKPAFFRWIFFERINNIILGGYLTVFFVLGVLTKQKKFLLLSLLVAPALFLFVFQGGNIQHEYYQTLILPVLASYVGVGVYFLYKNYRLFISPLLIIPATIGLFAFSFLVSFYTVKNYYNYSQDMVNISNIIRDLTKPEDKIVTDSTGDTTLLYLSQRRGAPAPFKDLDDLKQDGYKYFVTFNNDVIEDKKAEGKYELVFGNEKFAIFRL